MAIKTLVVDDSVLFRKVLSDALASFSNVELVGTAPSGRLALRKIAQTPVDLVLLDVHMDDMDGIETLSNIRKDFPAIQVVMISGISTRGAESTIKALEMGALDFIKKPDGKELEENIASLKADLRGLLRHVETRLLSKRSDLGAVKVATPPRPVNSTFVPAPTSATPSLRPVLKPGALPDTLAVLAIGVSTGGPEALSKLIPSLPADLGVPVVLVQHMPPHFTKSLAESLDKKSKLRVVEVQEGDDILPNQVHIAQGGFHFAVQNQQGKVKAILSSDPPENSCRPAVDLLFRSVADVYGDKGVLAVILTGMGNDGMKGVHILKKKKCYCLAQSESTCVVYGMPKAVDDARLTDESVDIEKMAHRIAEIANHAIKR